MQPARAEYLISRADRAIIWHTRKATGAGASATMINEVILMKRTAAVLMVIVLCTLLIPTAVWADSNAAQVKPPTTGLVTASTFAWVRSGPGTQYKTLERLYRGTSVTILETVQGQTVYSGQPNWYRIGEGRYIYSALVKVTSAAVPGPGTSPQTDANAGKWIEVDLSDHLLTAWDGNTVFLTTLVSIGKASTPTVTGTFHIYAKYHSVNMSGPGYYQPNVPHTMFFYRGYAIHGAYWRTTFGLNVSHGCVNLNLTDAATLYDWAPTGTKVVIHA
jgi:lipoprotein-anchoring transpeptidase ErfK/SrfK